MIYLSTFNFNEAGFISFDEDQFKTRFPEVKRNVTAYPTLSNDAVLDDRGLTYLNSRIEFVSKQSLPLSEYRKLRRFIEQNGTFKIACDTGVFEVFKAVLTVEAGTRIKITANVKKLIRE